MVYGVRNGEIAGAGPRGLPHTTTTRTVYLGTYFTRPVPGVDLGAETFFL